MIDFELIYSTLFARVSAAAGFATTGRRLKHWADVPSSSQPALFQAQKDIAVKQQRPLPPVYTLDAEFYIYAFNNDPNSTPATILNQLVAALIATLAPDPVTNVQTLGLSTVQHAWIEGAIKTDEGALGDQAVAIVPVKILTA
jgi:hypothetical protein